MDRLSRGLMLGGLTWEELRGHPDRGGADDASGVAQDDETERDGLPAPLEDDSGTKLAEGDA